MMIQSNQEFMFKTALSKTQRVVLAQVVVVATQTAPAMGIFTRFFLSWDWEEGEP